MMRALLVVLVMLCAMGQGSFGQLAAAPLPAGASGQPLQIDADALTLFEQEQRAMFKGNVVAKQGDMTMRSQELEVFYAKGDEGEQAAAVDGLEKLIARGNVVLNTGQRTAKGNQAVYEAQSAQVILTGNVRLMQGENALQGQRFTYDTRTKKSHLDGGNAPTKAAGQPEKSSTGRVRATFTPKEKAE